MQMPDNFRPNEFFPTPYALALSALEKVNIPVSSALDAGAGSGIWGEAYRDSFGWNSFLTGVELRITEPTKDYDNWIVGNYLDDFLINLDVNFHDLIFGNPPYSLAREFVERSFDLVRDGGYVVFLMRLAFLEGQKRGETFWPIYKPHYVYVCSRRPSFTGNGHTDTKTAYGVFYWEKAYKGDTILDWLRW